jgi:hypothetical protein
LKFLFPNILQNDAIEDLEPPDELSRTLRVYFGEDTTIKWRDDYVNDIKSAL